MTNSSEIRSVMRAAHHRDESKILQDLIQQGEFSSALRQAIQARAVELVERIRSDSSPGLMEVFLAEYGLSSEEGVALMCLAEALLRVPDADTIDALIEDKIAPSEWGSHLGHSSSTLVNASTWALFMTGKVLRDDDSGGVIASLRGAVKRLGEPVIRTAVKQVMKEMGAQFVLGQSIEDAMDRAKKNEKLGFTHSYDMLGEAARTEADARRYHLSYSDAITAMAKDCTSADITENPGISVKLSALHPRYEYLKKSRVMEELVPRARSLALLAKSAGMGFNIDAEEAARLDLSLDVIEAILADPALKGWDGFGIVVQAFSKRAPHVIDYLYDMAQRLDRKIMVRLVKGAYWDTEIKLAQAEGHPGFPVFTRKPSTDVCYLICAQKLLGMTDRIYPQFATHNAHTVAAVLEMAADKTSFEFQRLHGMGESLHDTVLRRQGTRCRIYAPVGKHKDLLAYLVRRLLENGANSSFVNQIVDEDVPPEQVVADPFSAVQGYLDTPHNPQIQMPDDLYGAERTNSQGWDLSDPVGVGELLSGRESFADITWNYSGRRRGATKTELYSPTNGELVGKINFLDQAAAEETLSKLDPWTEVTVGERAEVLRHAADLYEENAAQIFALLAREAGKTLLDCVGELREAVDFLRFYATEAERLNAKEAVGIVTCISPWNFPLAIFTGQISAALAAGNAVAAKPAETTPLVASFAVNLLHKAGVPTSALQLVTGYGGTVGVALTADNRVGGVCFTGSTATAMTINKTMAKNLSPHAPLIAETGGLNAMIVDSTALPEQAVRDILASSFQSAGQRCSALRVLHLQKDVAKGILEMLFGAMDELQVGDPWDVATDIGPVIDKTAQDKILAHIEIARKEGRLLKQLDTPKNGTFVGPAVIKLDHISDLKEEIFGPVLHVVTFEAQALDQVIDSINATGYGLTFGLHTRIDDRVQHVVDRIEAGNIYVNRNQIGAIVGSQPFGGEGLSGTGPKAGGRHYVSRFIAQPMVSLAGDAGQEVGADEVDSGFSKAGTAAETAIDKNILPGPTGESNRLTILPKSRVLCLGPTAEAATKQLALARSLGSSALAIAPGVSEGINGTVSSTALQNMAAVDAVVFWGDAEQSRDIRQALAKRDGAITPLIAEKDFAQRLFLERHVCVDTTAAGGNASLLAVSGDVD